MEVVNWMKINDWGSPHLKSEGERIIVRKITLLLRSLVVDGALSLTGSFGDSIRGITDPTTLEALACRVAMSLVEDLPALCCLRLTGSGEGL